MQQQRKNYITPEGFSALQAELRHLRREERPKVVEVVSWAAGNSDGSENGDYFYGKKRLREIDGRIRHLIKRLESAEVVDPAKQTDTERIYFGATVTYEDQYGREKTVRIVGIDEARSEENKISWISPVARALIKASEGDVVSLRTPDGDVDIEVIEVRYESAGG